MRIFRLLTSGSYSDYSVEGLISFEEEDLKKVEALYKRAAIMPTNERKAFGSPSDFPSDVGVFRILIKQSGLDVTEVDYEYWDFL